MSGLTVNDFPCPTCRAQQGQPCASLGGAGKKAGEPTSRPHAKRAALVPKVGRAAKCGTRGGYLKHLRNGTQPCSWCMEANAAYMADYRASNPENAREERRQNKARSRALWRLARSHPDEFREYVVDELRSA